MSYSTEQKWHEKLLSDLVTPEGTEELIQCLLGLSDKPLRNYLNLFNERDKIKIPSQDYLDFEVEYLTILPKLDVNYSNRIVEDTWKVENNELMLANFDEYCEQLEKSINDIYPYGESYDENTVPVTILIPGSHIHDSTQLDQKKTSWNFIKLYDCDEREKQGITSLASDKENFMGLRLFFVFKILGLVKTQQPSKNVSKIFTEILQATNMIDQFQFISTKKVMDRREFKNKSDKLNSQIEELKFSKKKLRNKKARKIITNRMRDLERLDVHFLEEFENYDITHSSETPKTGFYYSIPETKTFSFLFDSRSGHEVILPVQTTNLEVPEFVHSTTEVEPKNGKPVPIVLKQMRFMLSFLLPMTSGTAITIKIKKTDKIKAPLLILPRLWNKLAMGMKEHRPKVPTKKYDDAVGQKYDEDSIPRSRESVTEWKFRETSLAAMHEGLNHELQDFMRILPSISYTSTDDVIEF